MARLIEGADWLPASVLNTLSKVDLFVNVNHVHGKAISNAHCSVSNQPFVFAIHFEALNSGAILDLVKVTGDGSVCCRVDVYDMS